MNLKVGWVTHYYEKISVAVIELTGDLAVGDRIRFVRGGEELFEQTVESIQIEHEKVQQAHRGDVVGLKTVAGVKSGAEVFKI